VIPLVGAAEMRALDGGAIALGLPAFTLMELAGRGVVEHLLAAWPRLRKLAVVCGPGGNGGDGFAAARLLRDRGVDARVYLVAPPSPDSAAGQHAELYRQCLGPVDPITTAAELETARDQWRRCDVILDGLFGVGLARPVTGHPAQVIDAMNAVAGDAPDEEAGSDGEGRRPALWAIDLPSGLDADRGVPLGTCVRAQATVSLGLHKLGAVTSPGFACAGALHLVDLGLPRLVTGEPGALVATGRAVGWLEERDARALVPSSSPLDHKGRRGHVLVIGGGQGTRGAAELASVAAMRAGCGLCTWAAPGPAPRAAEPALMTRGFNAGARASASAPDAAGAADAWDQLAQLAAGKDALCLGPGLGRDIAAAVVERWFSHGAALFSSTIPLVLDADALFALADYTVALPGPAVLTPHPKEAARLLDLTVADVEADRLGAARAIAARYRAVVVLKGARTIICDGARAWLCSAGSPALATGGSGDVLAGAIAGLCAQGLSPASAALLGVWVHATAGRHLGERLGVRGVLSSELPAQLGLELSALAQRRADRA
jgi:ADP-dependent NAD(P)H-hydrate dehydratase / NAD(P)H-hydrate epimerase